MPFRQHAKPEKFECAKRNRLNPTKAEADLWEYLELRPRGLKFRRQEVILGWIADFYCAKGKLVIEVDGGYHQTPEQIRNDAYRDSVMRGKGLEVLRITNREIEKDFLGVIDRICKQVHQRKLVTRPKNKAGVPLCNDAKPGRETVRDAVRGNSRGTRYAPVNDGARPGIAVTVAHGGREASGIPQGRRTVPAGLLPAR